MKRIIFTISISFSVIILYAQNIGIGTFAPGFKLDVRGSINTDSLYRIGGSTGLSVKGTANTFVGINSGLSIDAGSLNTAVGIHTLYSDTTGSSNTTNGVNALHFNTAGNFNTGTGVRSLFNNSTGTHNVATGYESLNFNTTASYNVANGNWALYGNSTGSANTSIGHQTLLYNSTGSFNVATGIGALFNNTSGKYNTSSGAYSLSLNSFGGDNTAIGAYALQSTTGSFENTAIGSSAGAAHDNGYYNTFLGSYADANGPGYYNSIAIGRSATVTAPVQVRIGTSFISSIGGYQNWTSLSDGRFKKNIKEDVRGLDFIMKLRPVTYNMDVSGISEKLNECRNREMDKQAIRSIAEKEKITYSGFVAQEVEQAAKKTGYDFSGVDKPKNADDFYGLRYAEFVVPLVKAVQEQQVTIESLQKQVDELKKKLNRVF